MQTTLVPPPVESSPEQPVNNSPETHTVEETTPETICEMITDVVPEVRLSSGREQHVQPSRGGTEPGLFREIMETGVSLAHSEDR